MIILAYRKIDHDSIESFWTTGALILPVTQTQENEAITHFFLFGKGLMPIKYNQGTALFNYPDQKEGK